jgi:hypothetical protein
MLVCPEPQLFCEINPGQPLPLVFTFQESTGSPIDITDKVLIFTVRNVERGALQAYDMQISKTFPADGESLNGIGTMAITSEQTAVLRENEKYHFNFMLNGTVIGFGEMPTGYKVEEVI